jgi:hypothetical protein
VRVRMHSEDRVRRGVLRFDERGTISGGKNHEKGDCSRHTASPIEPRLAANHPEFTGPADRKNRLSHIAGELPDRESFSLTTQRLDCSPENSHFRRRRRTMPSNPRLPDLRPPPLLRA